MITIKLDDRGDILLEKVSSKEKIYSFQLINDNIETLKQRLCNRLKLFSGEWFLDKDEGIDWFGLFEKPFSIGRVKAAIRKAISNDSEVDSIESLDIQPDFKKRVLFVAFSVRAGGQKISINEELS